MAAERLSDTVFYSLEKAIKSYRQFAQQNIDRAGVDITIDQWLVLKTLQDTPDIMLTQVARNVFKDVASVTRIIQLLESKGYVTRETHARDGRRSRLALTRLGIDTIRVLQPTIGANRRHALRGISDKDLARTHKLLDAIASNCHPEAEQ
ncbi:MAG: MarR family transcriptional regulator [Gemmatimonadales bacterium]